jgi:predicted ribosomally synthesized peptide with nif11-like leader
MSIESAKKFYEKIQKDDALKAKLEAASKAERPQILKNAGYDFTKEEMKEVAASNTELSADDLANITGGKGAAWVSAGATAAGAVAAAF